LDENLGIKTLGEGWRIKNWQNEVAHSSNIVQSFKNSKSLQLP
jgi:hypothetical protein